MHRGPGTAVAVIVALCVGASAVGAQEARERTAVGQPSLADSTLTLDVWGFIKMWEMAGQTPAGCGDTLQLGDRLIAEAPKNRDPAKNSWVEHWTVRRCRAEARYKVTFMPAQGGTSFDVARLEH